MTKALVFAGSSFVGTHLCGLLREMSVDVTATSRRGNDGTVRCDLTSCSDVFAVVRNTRPDWIIQCGAATASASVQDHYDVHVGGAVSLLDAAHELVPEASIVLFGSAAEFGAVPAEVFPIGEDSRCWPESFFGASKLAQTQLAVAAAATNRQSISIVRPFNIIGPGLPEHYFAAAQAKRLLNQTAGGTRTQETFEVYNADSTRDFVDVRDVVSAVYRLLSSYRPPLGEARIVNIATGIETSIREVAEWLGQLAGGLVPVEAGRSNSRAGISRSCGQAEFLNAIGWHPQYSWQDSVRDLWNLAVEQNQRTNAAA